MTEDAGLQPVVPVAVPEPAEEAMPEPEPVAALPVAEEAPAPAGLPQAREEPPDSVLPPFIPGQGVPEWLRDALHELHRRLRNVERA